ncbi:MAG TPA: Crp/Fnr family transcriptional regulator [Nevskiaceae bacterium]|nr:Crp/Fnr family transcriptional regulator [Nevskiaceae bacterium]
MQDTLAMCGKLPERRVARGETLIDENVRTEQLFVLKQGAFDIRRGATRLVQVRKPGAFLGEISAVMGSMPTATVVAAEDSVVHVVETAPTAVRNDPELTLAIAQTLAQRLTALSSYLVNLKQQYAGTNTHLAVMDQVLSNLMVASPDPIPPGSEREDVPEY